MKLQICLAILLCFVLNAFGQDRAISLSDKPVSLKFDHTPLASVLRQLLFEYDVSVGFEESTLDRGHDDYSFETNRRLSPMTHVLDKGIVTVDVHPVINVKEHWISIDVSNTKLPDALDIIVRQMGNYAWKINGDVVNIFPVAGRDPRFESLLDLKIKDFKMSSGVRVAAIRYRLFELPEVAAFLSENKILYSDVTGPMTDYKSLQQTTLHFNDLTLLQLLNSIAKTNHGGWIVKSRKQPNGQGTGYIELQL